MKEDEPEELVACGESHVAVEPDEEAFVPNRHLDVLRLIAAALVLEVLLFVLLELSASLSRFSVRPTSPFLARAAVGFGTLLPVPPLSLLGVLLQVHAHVMHACADGRVGSLRPADVWAGLLGVANPSAGIDDVVWPRLGVTSVARLALWTHVLLGLVCLSLLSCLDARGWPEWFLVTIHVGTYALASHAALRWS